MVLRNLPYLLGQGIRNIFKHKLASSLSLIIMVATIFLFSSAYAILMNVSAVVEEAESNVGVTVFFDEGLTEEDIWEIGDRIGADENIARMVYTSAEEAWESFKLIYFEGDETLAEGFAENNPLANCASYEIFLSDLSKQQEFVDYLRTVSGVRKVNYSNVVAEGLNNVGDIIRRTTMIVLAVLIIIAVSLISNSISLTIAMRADEIHIQRYLGASASFIRLPFLLEGAVIGLVGAAIPLVPLWFYYDKVLADVSEKLSAFGSFLNFLGRGEIFKVVTPVSLLLGVGVGLLGGVLSIRRHVRV